jgi:ribosomal protein S6--L-glutamate ligase
MRIAVIARPASTPAQQDMTDRLRGQGCDVDILLPDEQWVELGGTAPAPDITVLTSATTATLALAAALHAGGVRAVNSYPSVLACHDKTVATRTLQLAGLPVPRTWLVARPADLRVLLRDGPLVMRPVHSTGGAVHIVRGESDLPPATERPPWLVQRFHQPDGASRRLYAIDGAGYCVLRSWPYRRDDPSSISMAVSPRMRDLLDAAGAAFGLDLFALDVVVSEGVHRIVDISGVPSFGGVPDAGARLADYVCAVAVAGTPAGGAAALARTTGALR